MTGDRLAQDIYEAALTSGFDDCGVIAIGDMDGYGERLRKRMEDVPTSRGFYERLAGMADVRERFPWARSLVICATWLGKYRYPAPLRGMYAKAFFLSPEGDRSNGPYLKKVAFLRWFADRGIRCEGGTQTPYGHQQVGSLRHAAIMAGIGLIRKNNFLYGEKGSYLELDGYVIDRDCRLYQERDLRPCPEGCALCQTGCPTGALSAPYTMDPTTCVSLCTTFGQGRVPSDLEEERFGTWLVGCDACQDCCPFNRHDWDQGEDFPGLEALLALLSPEGLLAATDEELIRKVCPRTVDHVPPEQVGTLRVNAERVLRNRRRAAL